LGHEEAPEKPADKAAKKSKVPEPIATLAGQTVTTPGSAKTFEEYKARRQAEKRK